MHTVVDESTIISKILHEIEMPQAPNISLVGMASAGKSSLVNALFGNPISDVKKSVNTTDCIVKTTFKSELVIYDTPGVGGDERLENLTRAFLGLHQLPNFHNLTDIPFKEYNEDEIMHIPVDEINHKAPVDFILFVVDLDRALLRNEQKDIELLIEEISSLYKNRFMVVGTHLDLIENLEEKQEIIESYKSLSNQHFVCVSSVTGRGLDNLVISLFNLMPNETYLSKLQQSLVDARKIAKDRLAVIDVSKRTATILTEDGDKYSRKLRILALYSSICNHYAAKQSFWETHKETALKLGDKISSKTIKTPKDAVFVLLEILFFSYDLIFSFSDFKREHTVTEELAKDIEKETNVVYGYIKDNDRDELSLYIFKQLSNVLL